MPKVPSGPPRGPPPSDKPERPSVIKDKQLKSLGDDDADDNGWAGAQEEVDYNAKLKFDESDDSEDEAREFSRQKPKDSWDDQDEPPMERQERKVRKLF